MKFEIEEGGLAVICFLVALIFLMYGVRGCDLNDKHLEQQLWKATNNIVIK